MTKLFTILMNHSDEEVPLEKFLDNEFEEDAIIENDDEAAMKENESEYVEEQGNTETQYIGQSNDVGGCFLTYITPKTSKTMSKFIRSN